MVTEERRREALELVRTATEWAGGRGDILAVGLVGSWARDAARMDSDVDLIVITDDPAGYVSRDDWIAAFGARAVLRTQQWGPLLTERRLARESGLEVEVGLTTREWARTDPVDDGTRGVVTDGMRILYDPDGILAALDEACSTPDFRN